MLYAPFESGYVCSAKTELAFSLYHEKPVREFNLKPFHDCGCTVWRAIFYYENMISSLEREYCSYYIFDILLLVVGRDYCYFPIHMLFVINLFQHFCDGSLQLLVLSSEHRSRVVIDKNVRFDLHVLNIPSFLCCHYANLWDAEDY